MADVVVFVEVPSGSRNKYELDEELGAVVFYRRLFTSMAYHADYGFIEGARGEDGDPLNALVLVGEPTFPGCRIRYFFQVYKDLEVGKGETVTHGFGNRAEAERVVEEARARAAAP